MTDYIKLPRSALTDDLWRDGNVARVYLYLLSMVDKPLSFREASKSTGLSFQQVRTAIDKLKSANKITQIVTQKTTQVSTQITLCGIGNKGKSATQVSTQIATQVSTQAKPTKFTPPTDAEVKAFVLEKGYHFDPESFAPWYESKGWKVGDQPMKDWKAACRTWEIRWKEKHGEQFYYQIQQPASGSCNRLAGLKHAAGAILRQTGNIDAYFNDKG